MELEFAFNGQTYKVELEPAENTDLIQAKINGESFDFHVSRISDNQLLLMNGGEVYRIFTAACDGRIFVYIDGKALVFDRADDDQKTFSRESLDFGARDEVTTPMPGKIVKILVGVGEKVQAKQPLVIVESMKMENEIKSPTAGTIKSIHFAAGDLVGTNQPIIKLEPEI
jgi:biotin carboxyl carrier protein